MIEPTEIRNPDLRTGPAAVEYQELRGRQYAEPPAIVGLGVLPRRGFAVVGGPPKVGKSSLLLNIALRRALGQPWLGFVTTPGRTMALNAEIPERELQARMRLMAGALGTPPPDNRLFFVTHRGIRLDRNDGLQTVRRLLEQTRADCLIVDPLARFRGDRPALECPGRRRQERPPVLAEHRRAAGPSSAKNRSDRAGRRPSLPFNPHEPSATA